MLFRSFSDDSSGAHEWLIEFDATPNDFHDFKIRLDESLKKFNSDYEAKRYKDKVLSMPIVRVLPNGSFYNWMKSREKLGGQNKVPRLSNNRTYVDDLLKQCFEKI